MKICEFLKWDLVTCKQWVNIHEEDQREETEEETTLN